MTEPCNMCGRPVASFFDHVDVDCINWPDRDAKAPVEYRGYVIETHQYMKGFQYVHEDYDGPEDNRHGSELTLELCYAAIDEACEDV